MTVKRIPKPSKVGPELAKLAEQLLQDALGAGVELTDRLDVFKAVTTYHLGVTKTGAKEDDQPKTGGMNGFKSRIDAANGSGAGDSGPPSDTATH